MEILKRAVCGAGRRGTSLCEYVFSVMKDIEVVAIADPNIGQAEKLAEQMTEKTGKSPAIYDDYLKMFDEKKPDAVFIASNWETHREITFAAFERGIAVALEVGGTFTEAEWRELIEAQERTKTPFMFMENCCFGKEELFATSLARNGILGEVVYCHGSYMHDLRRIITHDGGAEGNFRSFFMMKNLW